MFEDLDGLDNVDISDVKNVGGSSSEKKAASYQGGNYSRGNFQKKEEVVEDPYRPVVVYVDRDFPPEVKTSLYNIASKLISKKVTVRFNGDDKEFYEKLVSLSKNFTEAYIPWRNFNEIESKHYYNTLTSKHIAQTNFIAWDKIPDSVKALLARNVRMLFGDKNNSVGMCLITWSKDGASKLSEITKDTGRSSFILKVAGTFGFPILNIAKENSGNILERTFGI